MKCRIAHFNIDFKYNYRHLRDICTSFNFDFINTDLFIDLSLDEIKFEKYSSIEDLHFCYFESILAHRKLAEWLPTHGAFVLHSACFDVGGVGVAFAAHSGTGKTTHMRLWKEYLGDKMVVVNGDKPIVRFFEDEPETPYAYGTPWNGKEGLGCNMRTPMKHICFIERAEENSCEPMGSGEAIDLIFNQVYMPKDPLAVLATMQLINRFINSCTLWKIKCNMDISAAEVAYKTIFPEG